MRKLMCLVLVVSGWISFVLSLVIPDPVLKAIFMATARVLL
ncbi:hypothetical protein ACFLV5_03100 [Chloroflexota bacterium]